MPVVAKHPSQTPYSALLIRAWQESGQTSAQGEWRFRVQDLQNSKPQGFASLEALLDFLQSEFGDEAKETVLTSPPVGYDGKPTGGHI